MNYLIMDNLDASLASSSFASFKTIKNDICLNVNLANLAKFGIRANGSLASLAKKWHFQKLNLAKFNKFDEHCASCSSLELLHNSCVCK